MTISENMWKDYIARLRNINNHASELMASFLKTHPLDTEEAIIAALEYGYALATKYGEAAATLACMMYEAIAEMSGVVVPAATPAATATFGEVAKQIQGTMKQSSDPEKIASAVGRLVKLAGVDTTVGNAIRDGAEWAWIPHGDTCAFCMMIASNGWRKASKKAIKDGHAFHVHANCDCTYAVRFNENLDVEGYDPDGIYDMMHDVSREENGGNAGNWDDMMNAYRRRNYRADKDRINEQKRINYAERKQRQKEASE